MKYITIIQKDKDGLYQLDYPNFEVKSPMLRYLLETFNGFENNTSTSFVVQFLNAFQASDVDKVISLLKSMFAGLPYQIHVNQNEAFYHASIHLLFSALGLRTYSEAPDFKGRTDSVVETDTHVFILEFKFEKTPQAALQQIKDKNYAERFKNHGKTIIGIGINFSGKTKNIDGYMFETIKN